MKSNPVYIDCFKVWSKSSIVFLDLFNTLAHNNLKFSQENSLKYFLNN